MPVAPLSGEPVKKSIKRRFQEEDGETDEKTMEINKTTPTIKKKTSHRSKRYSLHEVGRLQNTAHIVSTIPCPPEMGTCIWNHIPYTNIYITELVYLCPLDIGLQINIIIIIWREHLDT